MEKSALGDKLTKIFSYDEKEKNYPETRDEAIKDKDKDAIKDDIKKEEKNEDIACSKDTKCKDEEKE